MCVCVTFNSAFLLIARAVRGRFPQTSYQVSTEASQYVLTRGTWFFAHRVEVVTVAGLMWVSWCVLGGAGFFLVLQVTTFSNSYFQSSQRRLGEGARTACQSAHKELEPTYPHQVYRLECSHLRNTSSMGSSVDQYSSRPTSFPT